MTTVLPPSPPPGPSRPDKQNFWLTVPGLVTIVVVLGMAAVSVWAGAKESRARAAEMLVDVASCHFAGDRVTVGLTVRNTGATTRSAHIEVEYRDADGGRIDRASITARDVAPGGTARLEESTQLDVPAATGTCEVTTVR